MGNSEWKEVKLREVAHYVNEKFATNFLTIKNYISTENLLPNIGGIMESNKLPTIKKVNGFKQKDTLFSNIRTYFKKIWFADTFGGASNDVLIIRSNNLEIVTNEYLYYCLAQDNFFDYTVQTSKGTKMPRGDKEAIMNYIIRFPVNVEKQKKITNIFKSLDDKIELNNQMNQTLEEMAQSIFKEWFVEFNFPNENGEPYRDNGGEMIESELGMIPMGWKVGVIDEIAEVVAGGTPSKKINEYFAVKKDIAWITPKDLSSYRNKFIERGALDITELGLKKSSAKLMPKGTVLFSSRAPIGYLAIAKQEITTNQGFKSLVPNRDYGTEYLYYMLHSMKKDIENNASGSTFKEVSGTGMKNQIIIIPLIQQAEQFENIISKLSSLILKNEIETDTLINTRDTLLPKLMSGEVRV